MFEAKLFKLNFIETKCNSEETLLYFEKVYFENIVLEKITFEKIDTFDE